jgi:hypothetical protein
MALPGQFDIGANNVTSYPDADAKQREAEVAEVFELVRAASELRGFSRGYCGGNPNARTQGPLRSLLVPAPARRPLVVQSYRSER